MRCGAAADRDVDAGACGAGWAPGALGRRFAQSIGNSDKRNGIMAHRIIQPQGWAAAKGYANGVLSENGTLYVGGQIGWDEN